MPVTPEPEPDGDSRPLPPSRPRGRPRLKNVELEVLAAAEALLAEGPVRDITMERVAQRAGIGKVTLYRRWPSRTALLADALLQRMATAMPLDEELPPVAAIDGHLRSMVRELGGATGKLARSVMGECLSDPATAVVLRERYLGHRRDAAIRIIARGLADGSFAARGVSPEVLHDMLYGAVWYRFLFGVGARNAPAVFALMEAVLMPAEGPRRPRPRRSR